MNAALAIVAALFCTPVQSDSSTIAYEAGGIRVIQRINDASEVVSARLYLLGGTRQLTAETAGLEYFLLLATEYGTEHFPGSEAHRAMARTGSDVTLDAGADWTVFGFTSLAQDFDSAWAVLADRITHPALTPDGVAQARGKLLTQAHYRYTEPDARIRMLGMRALFVGHPYALDPEGTEQSLRSISLEQLQAYGREQLVTSRMLVVLVGKLQRAHAESLVAQTLGSLPRGTYRWTLPPRAPVLPARWLIEHRVMPTNYMMGYFTGPPPTERGYWAFRVATALLSSQIAHAVRTRRSLSYAAYAPFIDRAIPVGAAYASTPRPDQVLPLIAESVQSLQHSELEYFDLSRFLSGYVFDYYADNSTTAEQADFLARAELYLGGYRQGAEFVRQMRSVSPHEVQMAATMYMSKMQFAYLGDTTKMRGHW